MQIFYTSDSPEMTERIGEKISEFFTRYYADGALIAMMGEMGVGKTAFCRGFCRPLGIHSVKSPTYTVVNCYKGDACTVYHFDMYRIEGEEDLYSIGFEDYKNEVGAYLLLEWSERVLDLLPSDRAQLEIRRTDDASGREIILTLPCPDREDYYEALSI